MKIIKILMIAYSIACTPIVNAHSSQYWAKTYEGNYMEYVDYKIQQTYEGGSIVAAGSKILRLDGQKVKN